MMASGMMRTRGYVFVAGVASIGCVIVSSACGPGRPAPSVPKIPFEALHCAVDGEPVCARLSDDAVGCCVTTPDGSHHSFRCPRHLEPELAVTPR